MSASENRTFSLSSVINIHKTGLNDKILIATVLKKSLYFINIHKLIVDIMEIV